MRSSSLIRFAAFMLSCFAITPQAKALTTASHLPATSQLPGANQELIIIDANVQAIETFTSVFETRIIEQHDSLDDLTRQFGQYRDINALHIVSHAEDGVINIGGHKLDLDALNNNPALLQAIDKALIDGGDLLLYGCNLAKTQKGQQLLQFLAAQTNSHIAASTNVTGSTANHADWSLEYRLGEVTTQNPFNEAKLQHYPYTLADFSGLGSSDSGGSGFKTINDANFVVDNIAEQFGTEIYFDHTSGTASATITIKADGVDAETFDLDSLIIYSAAGGGPTLSSSSNAVFRNASNTVIRTMGLTTSKTLSTGDTNIFSFFDTNNSSPVTGVASIQFNISVSGIGVHNVNNITFKTIGYSNVVAPAGNNPPSDIALNNTAINQSATGAAAVVGGLSTTDADGGDTHTYSLVNNGASANGSCTASGDDDNASFQVDNTNDDLETGSSLAPGTYSVCIETDDGTDSYQESFTITVADNVGPTISSVSIPNTSMKVGDVVTATLTVSSDSDDYTTSSGGISGTIGGFSLSNLSKTNNTTYTASFTVTNGGTDIAAGSDIPVSITLTDSTGNASSAYTTAISQGSDAIDANIPNITNVGIPNSTAKVGDAITVTITAGETGLSLNSGTVNGVAVTGFTDIGGGSYTATYTVVEGNTDRGAGSDIPVSFVLNDSAGNTSSTYTTAISQNADAIDANSPSVTNATIPNSAARVGDAITVSITAGEAGLALNTGTVNGVAVTGFTDVGGGSYSATYTVAEGNTDRAAGSDIPVSFVLTDSAGNNSSSYTTAISQNADAIDANSPTITSVSIPNSAAKVGDAITVTITASETGLTLNTGTINGIAVTGFTDNADNTYSATYTVAEGHTDRAAGDSIPVNFVLDDSSSNTTSAYTTAISQNADAIDANSPSVTSVTIPNSAAKVGDAITVSITASEAGLTLNSGTVNGVAVTGFTDNGGGSYSATYTVAEGNTDRAAGSDIPVSFVLTDSAGNNSATYTTAISQNADAIDANSPTISSVSIPNSAAKVGDAITVTITANEAGLSLNTGTVNGVAVTGFTDNADNTYSATYTVVEGNTDRAAGEDIPVNFVLDDASSNTSSTYTTAISQNADATDANSPTIASVSIPNSAAKVGDAITVTITASETGLSLTSGNINGVAITGFTDNSDNTYSATYTVAEGNTDRAAGDSIPVSLVLADSAGNNSATYTTAISQNADAIDANSPTITSVTIPNSSAKIGDAISVTITAGETGLSLSSGTVNGVAVTGFTDNSDNTYTATYTVVEGNTDRAAGSDIPVSFVMSDATGNASSTYTTAISQNADVIDANRPTLAEVTAVTTPDNDSTPNVTFSTNETGTLAIGGSCGTSSSTTLSSTGNQTITLTQTDNTSPLADGTYSNCTVTVTDSTGNASTALSLTSFVIDTAGPSLAEVTAVTSPSNDSTPTVTFSTNEVGTLSLGGSCGTSSSTTLSATGNQTITLTQTDNSTPLAAGTYSDCTVTVTDSTDNASSPLSLTSFTIDLTAPSVSISAGASDFNAAFTATMTFSENVTGFAIGDISASNANLSSFNATSSSVYTVLVTPNSEGAVTLDVASNGATDTAGNGNTAATQLSVNFDTTAPTVAITSTASAYSSAFTATFTFSEDVTGFAIGDIVAGNASLSSFSATSASVYTVTVTPSTEGSVTLDVAANTATDAAGNGNTAATQHAVTFDSTAPTVTITSAADPVNAAFTATITFNEDVTGFVIGDISAGNASLSSFSATSASVYTVTVTPTSDGAVTLDVAANVAADAAGNNNTAASQLSVTFDGTAPTVAISSGASIYNAAFTATITFSENVTGFAIGDISAGNANLSNFNATSASVYTVLVTPTADGAVTLDIGANVAVDTAGNNNTAATQLSVGYDVTAPTVALSATATDVNAAFTATITFSEDVTGFVIGDIVAGNASLSSFSATSSSVYSVLVTPTTDGAVTLDVAANVATDSAGNNNTAASQLSVTYDATAPTVAITTTSDPVNAAFTATITFSEDVTGFAISDIVAGNASLSSFSATSASVYSVTVTPASDGAVTLDVAANVAADAAGNNNTAAAQLSVTYDGTAPTVAITSAASLVNAPFTATITFSEDVTGFTVGDISAGNASLSSFNATSASVYSVLVTPTSDGAVTLDIAANVAADTAGNNNSAATQLSVTYDATAPTVALSATATDVNAAFTATITFSENVTGFAVGDIVAGNASLSSFSATSASVYTVLVTPTTDGAVTLDVAANVATDSAGNNNTAATQLSVDYDSTAPTVTITSTESLVNTAFTATVTFSEDVTGFAIGYIVAGNASLSNFSATSSSVYTVTVTPTSDGAVTLDVAANVALDTAGNNNSAASQLSVTYDGTAPTVDITSTASLVNAAFTATITFSEAVTGFSIGDISASNASLSSFSATSASVYTVLVTPTTDGAVTLDVAANVAADSAGNNNTAATQLSVDYDATSPTATITSAESLVNAAFTATITFSEDVTGFVIGDINAGNASLSSFSATSSSMYTVLVTPSTDGAVTLDVAANVATDSAGNNNTAATQLSVDYDSTAPTVLITSTESLVNTAFTATITFSEDVTGFAMGDISAGNASLSNFTATSASVYTVTVTPTSDGAVTLDVAANVAIDSAGNNNTAATQLSVTFDGTAPTVAITSSTNLYNTAFTATITFSEAVTGFAIGDISASNASLSNFTAASSTVYTVLVTPAADGAVTLDVAANVAIDSANNGNTAATQLSVIYDTAAPTLASATPAAGSVDIDRNTNITLTFSEAISAGSSNNTLALYDAADDSLIASTTADNGAVVISGSDAVWTTGVTLTPSHSYYLQVGAGSFYDVANNYYAGISDSSLSFTVFNAAPVANDDSETTNEDNSVAVDVLANDTDSDSTLNAASTTVTVAPTSGNTSVNTATGVITYTPDADFNGSDSFTYTVSDVYGKVSNGGLVTLTVTSVNDAPVAVNDMATTAEDNAVSIDVAANDTDVDTGDSVDASTLVVAIQPTKGTAVVTAGEIVYTPNANTNGTDSFTYTIEDQNGGTSNAATVVINVTGVNDLPVASDDTATTDEDNAVAIDVLANDSDIDGTVDATTVMVMTNPQSGSVSIDAITGEITYTPNADFNGTDSFTYVAQDDAGGTSNAATVTITVNSVNDAPVASSDTAVLLEDEPHIINVVGNDSDVDGTLDNGSLAIGTAATSGTATINGDGTITYTPNANFNGSDSFAYTVDDNDGATSNTATVTITVTAVNDDPLANDDTATTDEDAAIVIDLAANDSDVDGSIDGTSFTLVTAPTLGTVASNDDGTVTYTPTADTNGSDSFTYTFDDDQGATSNTAAVTVTVNAVNDAPTITGTPATTVAEDSSYSFTPSASDIDSTMLTFSQTGMPAWASFDTTTGVLSGTPTNDDVGTSGNIVITVSDGDLTADLAAFTITVTNTNDAPVISGTPAGQVDEDGSYSFTPTGSDVDAGDNLTYTATNLPSWASIDPATGVITGTPTNDDVGIYRDIVLTVDDGTTTTSLPAFSLTVANTNDAPVAAADSYTLAEGGILQTLAETGVIANDVDVDAGDQLTATLITGPTRAGNFTLNTDGSFSYRHNGSETRSDSFTYALSDGTVTLPATTVSLVITAVNDAPRFTSTPSQTAIIQGNRFSYTPITQDPDSVVDVEYTSGPSWLSFDGTTLSGRAPLDAATGATAITLTASDQSFDIPQTFNLTVTERDTTLVDIATTWQGLPAIVDQPLTLTATLTHSAGPAVPNGELIVSLQGADVSASGAGCTAISVSAASSQYTCPYSLAAGATATQTLTISRASEGNIVVNFSARDTFTQTEVGAAITDVSVTDIAVGQGNNTFNLANATSIASIDLDGEGSRELVAGTSLGGEVQLLRYDLANATATTLGTIANTGNTRQVKVGDINGDGLEDVIVVNNQGDATNVYYQDGALSFSADSQTQSLPFAARALLIDLDNDDLPELILGGRGNNLYIYPNIDGVYSQAPFVFNSPVAIVHFALRKRGALAAAYSGSFAISTRDAVKLVRFSLGVANNEKPQPNMQRKAGSEAVSEQILTFEELDSVAISGVTEIISQDLDNDGEEELVFSTSHTDNSAEQSGVTIAKVAADKLQPTATLGNASAKNVSLADFNGDGATDVLVANDNDSYQFYYGNGTATEWQLKDTIIFNPSTLVLPEDVDNDGLADVLIYEEESDEVNLYLSANDGAVGQTANLAVSASTSPISNTQYQWQYAVTLSNPAANSINNVTLTATLPVGIRVLSKPEVCTVANASITCNVASLPAGSEVFIFTLAASAKPAGSARATVTSDALDNDLSNNSAATDFAPLFTNTQVRVEGGGKSGGTVHPWMVIILAALLAIRFGEPLFKLLLTRIKQTQLTHLAENGKPVNYARFKPVTLAMAFLAMLLSSFNAKADDRWFIEANLGKASSHWNASGLKATLQANAQEVTITDLDDERGTQELTLGYRIKPMLAVELGYRDWGDISYSLEGVASNTDALLSATQSHYPTSGKGAVAGLRASYWHGDNLEGYAKLSAWDWSGEYTTFINNEAHVVETGDTDVVVSVGMNGYFFERYSAGVVWQSARLEGQRNVVVGFSVGVRF